MRVMCMQAAAGLAVHGIVVLTQLATVCMHYYRMYWYNNKINSLQIIASYDNNYDN